MRALTCTAFGPIDALEILEVAPPTPGEGELLVDVKAASLNFMDALKVQGLYQVKPTLPFIAGDELAGVVRALGTGVTNFRIGDRIAAQASGAFAEQAVVRASRAVAVPDAMSFQEAACFFVAYGTALRALKTCAGLRRGESLLVLGAAGGVGLAAVELGRAIGAFVIAVASTPEKQAACVLAGADVAIDYEGLRARCDELTQQRGVDVVFDPVGGELTETALRATGWRGRHVVVGFACGAIPRVPANLLLLKERTLVGVYLGGSMERDPSSSAENDVMLKRWYAQGRLRPTVREEIELQDIPDALERLQRRDVIGKVVAVLER